MAYKLINETYCPYVNESRKEFICDTDADFENLPESCVGSTAVSIESGKVMVVNTEGEWIPFADSPDGGGTGSGGNFEKKFRSVIVPEEGCSPFGLIDYHVITDSMGASTLEAGILPTKTTEDILISGADGIFFYYIENENDIYLYGDVAGTGENAWMSMGELLSPTFGSQISFVGAITDITQATAVGYYALIYYVEKEA